MKLHSDTYDSYKKAEGEWSQTIPTEWQEKRVKDLFRLVTQAAHANNDYELLSLYAGIGVKPRKNMEARGNKASSTDGYWIVKKNDIVVNKLLAWMGSVGLSEYDGVTSPAYDVLRQLRSEIDPRYFAYLFRTETAKKIFRKNSRGIMDMRLRLYFDKLGAITVPLPTYSEQRDIASYIDVKSKQIDKKINYLNKKSESFLKLKWAVINDAVLNGLHKDINYTVLNNHWIKKYPSHWVMGRLKDFIEVNAETKLPPDLTKSDLVEFIPMSNVNASEGVISNYSFVPLEEVSSGYTKFKNKDVIFAKITPCMENGNCAVVGELTKNICFGSTEFLVFRSGNRLSEKYLHYFLHNELFRKNAAHFMKGTAGQKRITTRYMLTHPFPLPPYDEQISIVKFLDQKILEINAMLKGIELQIIKLRQLRIAMINDAVTGRIKVRRKVERGVAA